MTPIARRLLLALGVLLVGLAIVSSAVLGTVGWWAVGFGVMTDCTNEYSCSDTGCSPCDTASRWLTVGGVTQLAILVAAMVALVRGLASARRHAVLPVAGAVLLALSVATAAGTTSAARGSYCRFDSPGSGESHCATDG